MWFAPRSSDQSIALLRRSEGQKWETAPDLASLPYALAFAAGAMIFVVSEEMIPESETGGNVLLATAGVIIGFAVMMILDVALG